MNAKKKILIVDDSEMNRALLEDMLSEDYDILEAENGLIASRIIQEQEMNISLSYTGVSGAIAFDGVGDAVRDTAYIKTADNAAGAWTLETVQTAK